MKAVIFAAGESTRTVPLTLTRPKPLLPVVNRPILAHQLSALAGLVDEAIMVVGYKREMIEEAFGDSFEGIRLQYRVQEERKGTGHALLTCADALGDAPFFAMNGDDLYAAEDLSRLADAPQGVLAKAVDNPSIYGVFAMDDAGNATNLIEKPADPPSNLVNTGAYKFAPEVLEVLAATEPSERGEIEITSAIRTIMQSPDHDFRVIECDAHWLPIGYAWHLITANAYLLDHAFEPEILGEVSPAAHLSGAVSVGKGTVIRPGVVIDGPVCIGEDCSIGPNAWLRPGTTIGNGCKVGQSVEIKCSVIMDGAKVPHLSYIGDSVVGANANIGCGTVTANFRHDGGNHKSVIKGELIDTGMRKFGTIIGDDVHTGINTAIYPGRKFWPHTSTLPGEVVQRDKMD